MRNLTEQISRMLTGMAKPGVMVMGRRRCAFHVMGAAGFALAATLGLWLTWRMERNLATTAMLFAIASSCFVMLAYIRKIVQGEEGLTYYHHEATILAASASAVAAIGQPVLPYLDVTVLSIGLFLACGRIGCFMVGCCHGRPSPLGVQYGPEAVKAGFTRYLEEVRLCPVQLMESAWVLATVTGGIAVMHSAPEGAALAWYSIVYGWGRFLFEFGRGDSARPYRLGFSEAQWTSLLLMLLTAGCESAGLLPYEAWHVAATLALVVTMASVRLAGDPARWLSHPRHLEQLAALVAAPRFGMTPGIGVTSLGIRVSASVVDYAGGRVELFGFSGMAGPLEPVQARRLAKLAARLRRAETGVRVFEGHGGAYHLIIPAGARQDAI